MSFRIAICHSISLSFRITVIQNRHRCHSESLCAIQNRYTYNSILLCHSESQYAIQYRYVIQNRIYVIQCRYVPFRIALRHLRRLSILLFYEWKKTLKQKYMYTLFDLSLICYESVVQIPPISAPRGKIKMFHLTLNMTFNLLLPTIPTDECL